MSKLDKQLDKLLRGTSDNSFRFEEVVSILKALKFEERIKGSHHIFTRTSVEEILNLQPRDGKAKAYQVKQIRDVIVKYRLADEGQRSEGDS